MARSAAETANTLTQIYDEDFRSECVELYRISWPQLRTIAGVTKLDSDYLTAVNEALRVSNYALIQFDDYFVVACASDFQRDRLVPDRVIESHIEEKERLIEASDELELESEQDELEPGWIRPHRKFYEWQKRHRQRLHKLTYDEIMALFERMEFREKIGHRLECNVDFQNIVMMAVRDTSNK